MMMTHIRFMGQLVQADAANIGQACVWFRPTNTVPYDKVLAIIDSTFEFHTILSNGTGWNFDNTAGGSIQRIRCKATEINCPADGWGVQLQSVGTTTQCEFDFNIHGESGGIGVNIGTSAGTHNTDNRWRLIINGFAGGTAFRTFGRYDTVDISIINGEGTPNEGLKLESGAQDNYFNYTRNLATTGINDQSGGQNNYLNYALI